MSKEGNAEPFPADLTQDRADIPRALVRSGADLVVLLVPFCGRVIVCRTSSSLTTQDCRWFVMNISRLAAKTGVVAAVCLGSVGLAVSPSDAASTAHQFTLCATGDYSAQVEFPGLGGLTSGTVAPGTCWTLSGLRGRSIEQANVYELDSASDQSVYIDCTYFTGTVGGGVNAAGGVATPHLVEW